MQACYYGAAAVSLNSTVREAVRSVRLTRDFPTGLGKLRQHVCRNLLEYGSGGCWRDGDRGWYDCRLATASCGYSDRDCTIYAVMKERGRIRASEQIGVGVVVESWWPASHVTATTACRRVSRAKASRRAWRR